MSAALAALLTGDACATIADAEASIAERLEELGDTSAMSEDDPRTLLAFLLRMARRELHFTADPAPAEHRLALEARLARRPAEETDHAQLFIDLDSTLRRARITGAGLGPGSACLAVGDDDALSLALIAMGSEAELAAFDVDERLLAFLAEEARDMGRSLFTRRVDVHEDTPAGELLDAFDVVVTDPPRSFDEAIAFLSYGARCLAVRPSSRLFYADHPDWNPELDDVLRALPGLGLEVVSVHRSAARYPLTSSWVPDLPRRARALGVSEDWLRALIAAVPAHSDLFELAPLARFTHG